MAAERQEYVERLDLFFERLGLSGREVSKRLPVHPTRGAVASETVSRWKSMAGNRCPKLDHLAGLVDNCIQEGRLQREDRARWLEAVDGILQPDRVDRATWERSLDGLPVDPAPPGPVEVCTAATLQDLRGGAGFGRDQVDAFVLRTVDVLRTSCGLSTAGAYAAIRRLLGQEWAFGLAVLEWRLGESGKVLFHSAEGRFDVLFSTGIRHSFHMVGDAAGPAMREEALHGT
jgi:hypothetical protein